MVPEAAISRIQKSFSSIRDHRQSHEENSQKESDPAKPHHGLWHTAALVFVGHASTHCSVCLRLRESIAFNFAASRLARNFA